MQLYQRSIVIARPREQVWALFTDFARTPHWRQYVTAMQRVDTGPLQVGSRIRAEMEIGGSPITYELEVVACDASSLWRHRTNETDYNGYIEYAFAPEGAGTRVTMTGVAKPISLYGWLALPLLWLGRNRSYVDQLPRLKQAAEARPDA